MPFILLSSDTQKQAPAATFYVINSYIFAPQLLPSCSVISLSKHQPISYLYIYLPSMCPMSTLKIALRSPFQPLANQFYIYPPLMWPILRLKLLLGFLFKSPTNVTDFDDIFIYTFFEYIRLSASSPSNSHAQKVGYDCYPIPAKREMCTLFSTLVLADLDFQGRLKKSEYDLYLRKVRRGTVTLLRRPVWMMTQMNIYLAHDILTIKTDKFCFWWVYISV